jgi:hypothetical protein
MGMFDWVRCTRVLPDGKQSPCNTQDTFFQTKCCGSNLDLIIIGDDGTLRIKRMQYGLPAKEDDHDAELFDYTGTIDFYGSTGEYVAEVQNSQVVRISTYQQFYNPGHVDETAEADRIDAERAAEWARLSPEEQDKRMADAVKVISDHMMETANRPGFMRRVLEANKKLVIR